MTEAVTRGAVRGNAYIWSVESGFMQRLQIVMEDVRALRLGFVVWELVDCASEYWRIVEVEVDADRSG